MTRMKHYHLGCGESLQSNRAELLQFARLVNIQRAKLQLPGMTKRNSGKRH